MNLPMNLIYWDGTDALIVHNWSRFTLSMDRREEEEEEGMDKVSMWDEMDEN